MKTSMQTLRVPPRRDFLKKMGRAVGAGLATPSMLIALHGCSSRPKLTWTPVLFDEQQALCVSMVSDWLLPRTDTESASELGVPKFIEGIVAEVMEAEDRDGFMGLLRTHLQECKERFGNSFVDLDDRDRRSWLEERHGEIEGKPLMKKEDRPFIWWAKELAIKGYFSTEKGVANLLNHAPIPQRYEGCINFEEAGGRTWL